MKKLAFIFPGQGSQYPGMGVDFYKEHPKAKKIFEEADLLLGFSLSDLMFEGPKETLTQTKYSQLAIFVMSMAILEVLKEKYPDVRPCVCGGLSLGEYSAICAAGILSFEDCLLLVQARGEAMQKASESHPGGLAAVLGLDGHEVSEVLEKLGEQVWIANLNCPKQVVISGSFEGLKLAEEPLKAKGAKRVIPLEVSGAFHSALMLDAQNALKEKILNIAMKSSQVRLVMNVPGDFVEDLSLMKNYLIQQVAAPTLWEKAVRGIEKEGMDAYIEIGPGKTLAAMNKKIGTTAPTYGIEKVEDLENIAQIFSNETLTNAQKEI